MARRSFKTHIQALEDAKQDAGGLFERNYMRYLEGTTLAGSSSSTFLSALPSPPQLLFIQLPNITPTVSPTPVPIPAPEPVSITGDDPTQQVVYLGSLAVIGKLTSKGHQRD